MQCSSLPKRASRISGLPLLGKNGLVVAGLMQVPSGTALLALDADARVL